MSDKGKVIDTLIRGFQFITEEVERDFASAASVAKFAHGRHAFQIRYQDGKVFRVAVEEWDEGRQQPVLPDG